MKKKLALAAKIVIIVVALIIVCGVVFLYMFKKSFEDWGNEPSEIIAETQITFPDGTEFFVRYAFYSLFNSASYSIHFYRSRPKKATESIGHYSFKSKREWSELEKEIQPTVLYSDTELSCYMFFNELVIYRYKRKYKNFEMESVDKGWFNREHPYKGDREYVVKILANSDSVPESIRERCRRGLEIAQ